MFDAGVLSAFPVTGTDARRWRQQSSSEPMDVDRSRKVTFGRVARKPAPMLVPDSLTVKIRAVAASTMQINDLESSLMIEWE